MIVNQHQKNQSRNLIILFFLALLLALGIGHRFNTSLNDYDSAGHSLETFNFHY